MLVVLATTPCQLLAPHSRHQCMVTNWLLRLVCALFCIHHHSREPVGGSWKFAVTEELEICGSDESEIHRVVGGRVTLEPCPPLSCTSLVNFPNVRSSQKVATLASSFCQNGKFPILGASLRMACFFPRPACSNDLGRFLRLSI